MYTVIKRMEISASHSLMLPYPSKCENLHGHNWIITVYCRSKELNEAGMVVDFSQIKEVVKDQLDHRHLNDVLPFNPTAENIAVFVRFSGCNLKCDFCDTLHESGIEMTDEAIIEEVCKYPCRMVILTGGEPGLWIDDALVDALHKAGKYVAIETNGTQVLPEAIDWVTCSPKEGTTLRIKHADEVKVVYLGQDVSPYLLIEAKEHFLQPCSCQNTEEVIAYIKEHSQWRLSLQTHKLINID